MTSANEHSIGPDPKGRLKNYLCLAAVALLIGGANLMPVTAAFDRPKLVLIGILCSAILLWSLEVLDSAVSALLVMVVLVLDGIAPLSRVWGEMGNPIVGLIVAVYVVAFAVKKSGLDRRIALRIIMAAGGRSGLVLLAIMFATYAFTFFIPTSMGRATIVLSIAGGLAGAGGMTDRNLLKAVFIAIPYVSLLASRRDDHRRLGNGLRRRPVYQPTRLHLELYGLAAGLHAAGARHDRPFLGPSPLAVPPEPGDERALAEEIGRQRSAMGPMTGDEWKVLTILSLMLCGWMTHTLHGLDTTMVALVASIVFFLPGIEIIQWRETAKAVNWGSLVLFSCGLALADAMASTGLAKTIAFYLTDLLDGGQPWAAATGVVVLMFLIRLGLNNITSALAVALPVVFSLAPSLGMNPVWLGMIAIAGSCIAFLLPSQSIAALASYGMRHFNMQDLRRAGIGATGLLALAIVLTALFYWPLIGYSPT